MGLRAQENVLCFLNGPLSGVSEIYNYKINGGQNHVQSEIDKIDIFPKNFKTKILVILLLCCFRENILFTMENIILTSKRVVSR